MKALNNNRPQTKAAKKHLFSWMVSLWVGVLICIIGFNFYAYEQLQIKIKEIKHNYEAINKATEQRKLTREAGYLAQLLIATPKAQTIEIIRQDFTKTIDALSQNHSWLIKDDFQQTLGEPFQTTLRSLYFNEPHQIDRKIKTFLNNAHTLSASPQDMLNIENPDFQILFQIILKGTLVDSLGELIKVYQNINNVYLERLQSYTNTVLEGNLILLVLLSGLVIFPMFRKIRKLFNEAQRANKDLNERSLDLERSQAAALSMMEDATLARLQAEKGKEAAQRLATIVETSDDAIIRKKLDGTITDWNKGAEDIYGYSKEEACGKHINIIVPSEKLQEHAGVMAKLKQGVGIRNFETVRKRKDGSRVDVSLNITPIKDAQGKWIAASTIGQDITLIKQAREAIEDRERWFRSLIENSSDLLVQLNPEGEILYASPSAEKLLGYKPDLLIGKNVFSYVHPEFLDEIKSLFSSTFSKPGEPVSGSCLVKHQNGSWRWFEGTAQNLLNDPNIRAIIANYRDVTDRKQGEEREKKYTQELKRSNEELENFAFIASHDLQEPLRIIASYAQLFVNRYNESLDENSKKYLNYISNNIKRMQDMINGLLSYSRAGDKNLEIKSIDSNVVCTMAIENLRFIIKQKTVRIIKKELPTVWAHEMELLQLFQNLINNAVKYCDKENPVVTISAKDKNGTWEFCVEDNGIGIDPEYTTQIFEIFKRLHTKAEYPGTGIGLAVCKKIIEKNAGRIWVESTPGQGSRFYFTLPKIREVKHEYQVH